jgi:hypothetical protein
MIMCIHKIGILSNIGNRLKPNPIINQTSPNKFLDLWNSDIFSPKLEVKKC